MTVSYKKSGLHGGAYYMSKSGEVDDYYTASDKEPPGVWYVSPDSMGARRTVLGVVHDLSFSSEDTNKFESLVAGVHPISKEKLVKNSGAKNRSAIHDFTLSPPKSISVIWSQAEEALKVKIESIQSEGARDFLDYLAQHAVIREGKAGVFHNKAMIRGAMFNHGSSRENDPQLHTHCVLMNIAEKEDGKTGALETRNMLRWQGAAASLYHAKLAYELRKEGFKIQKNKTVFEIEGVPDEVLKAFSQRRERILKDAKAEMERKGKDPSEASRALLQKIALASRPNKNEMSRDELIGIWKERGAALGFTEDQVKALITYEETEELSDAECQSAVKDVVEKILQTKAVFGEPELVAKSAVSLLGKASPEQILAAVEAHKKELLVAHGEKDRDTVYTSREMVALEQDMLKLAEDRNGKHVLENKSDEFEYLTEEQREAAEASIHDENFVTVVEGTAGAGKTFTMKAVARTYEENGYRAVGLATAWKAADNLKESADLGESYAITGWINSVKKGEAKLDGKTLLIVDEAGMVSTQQMRDVLSVAREHGAKVVLLGDTKQQKAVGAGAALEPIADLLGSHRLTEIRRQYRMEERDAIKQLFDGEADKALQVFDRREGGLVIREGDDEVNQALIDDWCASRSRGLGDTVHFSRDGEELAGQIVDQDAKNWTVATPEGELHKIERSHMILAIDNRSVRELNQLAQDKLKEAGLLGEERVLQTIDGEQEFCLGDEVQLRINVRDKNVFNRTQGSIEAFDGDAVMVRLANDDRLIRVGLNSKEWCTEDGDLAMQLAYATTVYSSQGMTVGHSFVKDGWSMARDNAGVAMSRHRESAAIYCDRLEHHARTMRKGLSEDWRPVAQFNDADVQSSLAKSWSKNNIKASTLHHVWQEADGAMVDREVIGMTQQVLAKAAAQRAEPGGQPLIEPAGASDAQRGRVIHVLEDQGIHQDAIVMAGKQGVLRVDSKSGEPVLCGRSEDGVLMQLMPLDGPQPKDLRGRFPPIIRGEGDETLVVETGLDGLHILSEYLDTDRPTPNIIITGGQPFALSGLPAKELLKMAQSAVKLEGEKSKTAERDQEREAVVAQAQAASQRSTAALQTVQQTERDQGLTR